MPRVSGSRVGLPEYAWDRKLGNYVNLNTGRMVKRATVNDLLRDTIDGHANQMGHFAVEVSNGRMTPREFYELMRENVRESYNSSAALGKGGWHAMTPADWGTNGQKLREEYRHLKDFAQDLADGKVTQGQAVARAKLYADSAYQRYWELQQDQQRELGNDEEAWHTAGDERVCPVCSELEARGWQPLGSLPLPGSPHFGCRCDKTFRKKPAGKASAWVVREFTYEMRRNQGAQL
jgi:hypothetical protein